MIQEEKARSYDEALEKAKKRETLFQMILANAIQSAQIVPARQGVKGETMENIRPFVLYDFRPLVDASIQATDYALEKLYPLPKEGEEK